ncbi:hypothetical protein ACTJLC_07195 [Paraburkholderia sp. 22099]|jgi:hypothetical protein|uniref:Uncharacterized protein n=1 Tax=Paraburkholderia terricola TaxID=169427 RepID=A0A1M6SVB5_9BURK|nr:MULTISPECIES: hypothetical protein [Paraburkholderia]AXE92996.1 hypothetical protein CUJ90_12110 [Paraburkholderia terricola]MDR6493764.1 hypothetical protein [Paraburkholderia terricola]SDO68104.1 hypothetical protein SAMN05192547_102362 [Paraburkholderia sediminicola]SHK48682.1 hypothetical protein SAMN05192548_102431 [Paraburkholderia terricola]
MKSRVTNPLGAIGQRPPRSLFRLPRTGLALGAAACALALSGCYYPYGYYPAYYPYYATVPATMAQREVPLGTVGDSASQPQQTEPAQQGQAGPPSSPPAYVVAQPPVYVAPAYPAYYPAPVYPAYPAYYGYGYPGWYAPSLSIGFGWGWGGHRGGRGYHH